MSIAPEDLAQENEDESDYFVPRCTIDAACDRTGKKSDDITKEHDLGSCRRSDHLRVSALAASQSLKRSSLEIEPRIVSFPNAEVSSTPGSMLPSKKIILVDKATLKDEKQPY